MAPAILAGLVREQSPDHASHTQEYIRTVAETTEDFTIEVRCSCPGRVGLTLKVPRTQPPAAPLVINNVVMPGGEAGEAGPIVRKGKVPHGA